MQNDPVNFIDPWGLEGTVVMPGVVPLPVPPVFFPGTPENDQFVKDTIDLINHLKDLFNPNISNEDTSGGGDSCPTGKKNKKYKNPPNPNKKNRTPKPRRRERNVRHPDGEEHSRRPKGGSRRLY